MAAYFIWENRNLIVGNFRLVNSKENMYIFSYLPLNDLPLLWFSFVSLNQRGPQGATLRQLSRPCNKPLHKYSAYNVENVKSRPA